MTWIKLILFWISIHAILSTSKDILIFFFVHNSWYNLLFFLSSCIPSKKNLGQCKPKRMMALGCTKSKTKWIYFLSYNLPLLYVLEYVIFVFLFILSDFFEHNIYLSLVSNSISFNTIVYDKWKHVHAIVLNFLSDFISRHKTL